MGSEADAGLWAAGEEEMSDQTIKCVCGAESKDTHGWRVFAGGRPSLCPACKWKTDQVPDCLNFKPSPLAAWMCARYITPDTGPRAVTQFEPFCALTNKTCPTAGLRNKPRGNYSPGDDGAPD